MGYETSDIIAAMPGLLNAAAAGQLDLGTTADITSNILSGFGLQASETANVADVLTKTFTNSNTDLNMLGESMKMFAPTANAMGISLEEAAAAVGILGNAGIQGSMAGSSLSMSLTRLASPSKEAAELMEELGFNAFDAEGKMLPLNDILGNLQDSTKGLTDEQRMHAISTIFGAESMKAMLTLMEAGPDTLSAFTGELENAGGTAETIASKQLDNLNGQFTILKSALEGAAISIGTALIPAVSWMAGVVQTAVDWFNGLNESTKTGIAVFAGLSVAAMLIIGPLLLLIGFLPQIFAGMKLVLGAAKLLGGGLAFLVSPIGLAIAAVVGLIAIFVLAYQKCEWFRAMVDQAWAWIKDAFATALEFIRGIVEQVMTVVSAYIGEKLAQITAFWDENGAMISDAAKNVFEFIKTVITTVMDAIWAVMQFVWPAIKLIVETTWNAIKNVIDGAINIVLGIIKTFAALFTGNWSAMWDGIKQLASGALELLWGMLQLFGIGRVLKLFGNVGSKALDIFKRMWNGVKDIFKTGMNKAYSFVDDGFSKVLNFITNLKQSFYNAGKGLIDMMAQGIKNAAGKVIDTVKNLAGKVRDFLPFSPSKEGPLRDLDKLDFAGPIANSLRKARGIVAPMMTDVLDMSAARAGGQSAPSVTNNTPVSITLNYSGSGSDADAMRMVDIVERELALRINAKNRFNGVRR